MRPQQRRVWLLPWLDERNAIACATQVVLELQRLVQDPQALRAAHLINAWIQRQPSDHDKTMIDALRKEASALQTGNYEMVSILRLAQSITTRALTNDLTSNTNDIRQLMENVMYANRATEYVDDAMAKWRFYDATGRKKMDNELRAAFEAVWLAGEYAASYEFVGAAWPSEWSSDSNFLLIEDCTFTGAWTAERLVYMNYGLIKRDVQ